MRHDTKEVCAWTSLLPLRNAACLVHDGEAVGQSEDAGDLVEVVGGPCLFAPEAGAHL